MANSSQDLSFPYMAFTDNRFWPTAEKYQATNHLAKESNTLWGKNTVLWASLPMLSLPWKQKIWRRRENNDLLAGSIFWKRKHENDSKWDQSKHNIRKCAVLYMPVTDPVIVASQRLQVKNSHRVHSGKQYLHHPQFVSISACKASMSRRGFTSGL